ncbi:MAG: tRNA threonylcarbamoyladenosine dehydratase [Cyclobacteriaceae bacterium]|nr:tRNA threonylcarbamoyladenosine dehydratase [Cyclobacteriaceae bacterium]
MLQEEIAKPHKNWTERTTMLLGSESQKALGQSKVLIAGLGGVGAAAAEMLARAGIGHLTLVDHDHVQPSNRNRQLCALQSTEGKSKTMVMRERLKDINPEISIVTREIYLIDHEVDELLNSNAFDYAIDAIDTLSPKIHFIRKCHQNNIPLISSMGAGGKIDPSLVRMADLSETYHCTLARYVRKKLKPFGIRSGVRVVFSPEELVGSTFENNSERNKKTVLGTVSYMPVIFGCYCASEVIRKLSTLKPH